MNSEMSSSIQSRRTGVGLPGTHDTPESEFSIEGFQNFTASEVFVQGLAGLVNQSDVESMIRAQKQIFSPWLSWVWHVCCEATLCRKSELKSMKISELLRKLRGFQLKFLPHWDFATKILQLQRFEKTNEMLLNCNALSQSRLKIANDDFKKHVKLLTDMKKDLDYIFRKVRIIKNKLSQQYPAAFAEALPQRNSLAEEAEDDEDTGTSGAGQTSAVESKTVQTETLVKSATHSELPADKSSKGGSTTVEYVQMEEAVDNGKPIENELIKRVCSIESANPNDSSDCTSEDTG